MRKNKPEIDISFCTVCMNRLHHLRETLPANIEDNLEYTQVKHILLDYNSNDGLEEWVNTYMSKYIEDKRLVYYRTYEPTRFNMAHSKNLAVKLSNSEYVCLIDADNFTGKGYARYVSDTFLRNNDAFITSIATRNNRNPVDVLGRVCFKRQDFDTIYGFDEFMNNYGFDDFDFCDRLTLLGRKRIVLRKSQYLRAISHSNSERLKNQDMGILDVFVNNLTNAKSKFMYIFRDGTYHVGTILDRQHSSSGLLSRAFLKNPQLKEPFRLIRNWKSGKWADINHKQLSDYNSKRVYYNPAQSEIAFESELYRKVQERDDLQWLFYIYPVLTNQARWHRNKKNNTLKPNDSEFGKGSVYKNFGSTKILV